MWKLWASTLGVTTNSDEHDYELDWHETTNLATNSSYDRVMAELLAQMKEGFEE